MMRTLKSLSSSNPCRVSPLAAAYISTSSTLLGRAQRSDNTSGGDEFNRDPDDPPRLFVVQPKIRPETRLKSKLEEALNLANSLQQQRHTEFNSDTGMMPHLVVQNPIAKTPRVDTFFGNGTVGNVKCHINNVESKDVLDAIFVNAILTGIQQRNLERAWGKPVLDRVGLIIEIFNAHAQTKEAKLQAELAALMYKRSRLVRVRGPGGRLTFGGAGEAEVVSARGRGSGGQGFISGAGETELQLQRRRISDRRKKLLSEIEEVRRTRAVQRAARRRQGASPGQDIPTVAVVGYTNAGKSTLVSALSNTYLYCDDRLFATVDPKLRCVVLPSGREVLLSDTVGFISDLPVQLVEAFHATLEEVVEADLLVHVLDSSAPNLDEHREAVMQVLGRLGVSDEKLQNMIEVWNKVDLQDKEIHIDEVDAEDYSNSCSGEDDDDVALEQLSSFNDIDQDTGAEQSGYVEQNICGEEADQLDGWLSSEDEQNSWLDGSSVGCETVGGQENKYSGDLETDTKCSRFPCEYTGHIKTSAVTGVGLKELLELIDEKLGSHHVVERKSIFDRKWRPPCREDNGIAIDQ